MHAHVPLFTMHWQKRLYSSFKWGEFVLVENMKGRQRLFQLKEGSLLKSSAGQVPHSDIVGKLPCQAFETDRSIKVWVRRPTLAEYVCLMQRAATPSYPKDIWAMLGYLDITGGARVIEAGSGSGALTLHLSNQGVEVCSSWVPGDPYHKKPDLLVGIGSFLIRVPDRMWSQAMKTSISNY